VAWTKQAILGEHHFDNVFDRSAKLVLAVDWPAMGRGIYLSVRQLREKMRNGQGGSPCYEPGYRAIV